MSDPDDRIRLDKWLWAARFYKTRALAAEAINGGKVHLDGRRVKAARALRVDDRLEITRGADRREIIVCGLSERRASATLAQTLYRETEASIERGLRQAEQRKLAAQQRPTPARRPDKKQRRHIRRFKQQGD